MRVVAPVGTGSFLGTEIAKRPGKRSLGAGAAVVGSEPVDRSRQRISSAPAVVRSKRNGCITGSGFRGGGKGPSLPVSGSSAGAQARTLHPFAAAMEGSVRGRIRCAVIRPDQHLCGRRGRTESQG